MINVEKELERIRRERREGIRRPDPHDYTLLYVSMISVLIGFFAGMIVMAMAFAALD